MSVCVSTADAEVKVGGGGVQNGWTRMHRGTALNPDSQTIAAWCGSTESVSTY